MSRKSNKRDSQQRSERFITAKELADRWRVQPRTIRNRFRNTPGVLRFTNGGPIDKKRHYVSLRIPERLVLEIERGIVE